MKKTRKITENALALGAVQIMGLILPFLALPYLARTLGPEQMGHMAFALAAAQAISILVDYGFNFSGTKAISINRDDNQKIANLWATITTIKIASALILGFAGWFVTAAFQSESQALLLACSYTTLIGTTLFPQWLFQGLEKLKIVSTIQVFSRIIAFALIFILIKEPGDVYLATALQGGGLMIGSAICIPLIIKIFKGTKLISPKKEDIVTQLKSGWHVFLSTAAINAYTTCNTFFLGLMVSPANLAQFHIAEKLIRAAQALYSPISNAIYPHISKMATENPAEALKFNRKLTTILTPLALIGSAVIFFISDILVSTMFGSEYKEAAKILKILCPLPTLIILSNILGIQTMLPFGMEKEFSKILLSSAILNFAIFFPLVYFYDVKGAAIANVCVEIFVTAIMAKTLTLLNKNPISITQKINY
jgi:O-antigen/teichoic acid export membrane protein